MRDTGLIRKLTLAAALFGCSACTSLAAARPEWAFFVPSTKTEALNTTVPSNGGTQWRPAGSHKAYTPGQLADPLNPPDWYPEEHPPMPDIVAHGSRAGSGGPPQLP